MPSGRLMKLVKAFAGLIANNNHTAKIVITVVGSNIEASSFC